MNQPTTTRTAFAAIINRDPKGHYDQFTLGLAEENTPGYWPQPQHGTFATYENASKRAGELNAHLFNLTPEDAARIVASSMFQSNRKRK